jgi:hypothetical protein
MTISELYEIMYICPLTFAKSMNVNFGSITLGVGIANVRLTGQLSKSVT